MGFRRFDDNRGRRWEIRPRSRDEWAFQSLPGNPEESRVVRAPSYEKDPFELSERELQRLLDAASAPTSRPKPSPFKD